jgi:hypothetical protein
VVRVPEVKFSTTESGYFDPNKNTLEFRATNLGEKVTQKITLSNSIPETELVGTWEVVYQSQDTTDWIRINKTSFKGNQESFAITVDTSKLIAKSSGTRKIILHTNTNLPDYVLTISVHTAAVPVPLDFPPINPILAVLAASFCIPWGYVATWQTFVAVFEWLQVALRGIW